MSTSLWYVYVIQSLELRFGKRGRPLPGFYYVGCTTFVPRRLRQHNGEIVGGGRYTAKHRPWELRAVWGPFLDQSTALKAERALKKGKRGQSRTQWKPEDSKWCPSGPNQGTMHPWVWDLSWKPPDAIG
jgi:putative endonuclease